MGTKSRICCLSIPPDSWGTKEAPFWPEDLDINHWFPEGVHITTIDKIPGTKIPLPRIYYILSTNDPDRAIPNHTLMTAQNSLWVGNIVVAAGSQVQLTGSKLVHFLCGEIALVNAVVKQ